MGCEPAHKTCMSSRPGTSNLANLGDAYEVTRGCPGEETVRTRNTIHPCVGEAKEERLIGTSRGGQSGFTESLSGKLPGGGHLTGRNA